MQQTAPPLIQIPTNNGSEYREYDFTWPENYDIEKNIVSANDVKSSLKNLTGFDSTISSGDNGAYNFRNMPTGAYVVRFHYGDINGDYNNESVTFATGSKLLKSEKFCLTFSSVLFNSFSIVSAKFSKVSNFF